MADEILDLNTIVKHDTIRITSKLHPKGKLYELANLQDLSPFDYRAMIAAENESDALLQSETKLTKVQERTLDQVLTKLVQILVPTLEAKVIAELGVTQRLAIKVKWAERITATGTADDDASDPTQRRPTTAARSRRSKNSTAATRKRGSTSQRG